MATYRQIERFQSAVLNQFPGYIYTATGGYTRFSRNKEMVEELVQMWERRKEFPNPKAALYAAIFNNPRAYARTEAQLDLVLSQGAVPLNLNLGTTPPLVIVGSGINAAVAAAAWFKKTGTKALVLERSERVGGTFGMTSKPAFRLNSRNRPGDEPGFPGTQSPLNVIPGAIVQPSDLSADEYQFNNALGFAVRVTLADFATVVTGADVRRIEKPLLDPKITLRDGRAFYAKKVIVATGLGQEMRYDVEGVMSYSQFMRRVDTEQFPMQGLRRIAVIGAGDGGKTVVEALVGQGPRMGMSVMSIDRPERIDWYGVFNEFGDPVTKSQWRQDNRSRYDGLARVLPKDSNDRDSLIQPKGNARFVTASGNGGVRVDGQVYDMVVDCRGYKQSVNDTESLVYDLEYTRFGAQAGVETNNLAKKMFGVEIYLAGPAANLPLTPEETTFYPQGIPQNTAAIFRYADRTAQLIKAID